MIRHIALFKFKPDTSQSLIDALMEGLDALPGDIPAIVTMTRGTNFSDRGQGHSHAAEMTFASRADLDGFYEHPAHVQLATSLIKPNVESLLIVDFEESDASQAHEDAAHERAA